MIHHFWGFVSNLFDRLTVPQCHCVCGNNLIIIKKKDSQNYDNKTMVVIILSSLSLFINIIFLFCIILNVW